MSRAKSGNAMNREERWRSQRGGKLETEKVVFNEPSDTTKTGKKPAAHAANQTEPDIIISQAQSQVPIHRGLVAQGIERLRPKEGAGGSSPSEAAKNSRYC